MEIRNGLTEGINRVFGKLCEESAEGFTGAFKYICVGKVYANGIIYILHEPPVAFIAVNIQLFAVGSFENAFYEAFFIGVLREMVEYV